MRNIAKELFCYIMFMALAPAKLFFGVGKYTFKMPEYFTTYQRLRRQVGMGICIALCFYYITTFPADINSEDMIQTLLLITAKYLFITLNILYCLLRLEQYEQKN